MRKVLIGWVFALLLVVAVPASALLSDGVFTDSNANQYQVASGAIRKSGSTWAIINDSAHEPLNLTGITCASNGNLIVDIAPITEVVGSSVVADETYTRAGVAPGASVGLDSIVLKITQFTGNGPVAVSCADSLLSLNNSNFWVEVTGKP